jgi:hypothetical protein
MEDANLTFGRTGFDFLFGLFFETRSHIAQAGLELPM